MAATLRASYRAVASAGRALRHPAWGLASLALCLAGFTSASGQLVVLNDNNSSASIDTASGVGMFAWSLAGLNNCRQQSFYYALGSGPQLPISSIAAPLLAQNSTNDLVATYRNATLSIQTEYQLQGGPVPPPYYSGSVVSDLSQGITLSNTGSSSLNLRFFQYANYQLAGGGNGDTVRLSAADPHAEVDQGLPGNSATLAESASTLFDHAEVGIAFQLLSRLSSSSPIVLNDSLEPAGPGEVEFVLEWDLPLAVGQSTNLSMDTLAALEFIPEPTASLLLLLGLSVLLRAPLPEGSDQGFAIPCTRE